MNEWMNEWMHTKRRMNKWTKMPKRKTEWNKEWIKSINYFIANTMIWCEHYDVFSVQSINYIGTKHQPSGSTGYNIT